MRRWLITTYRTLFARKVFYRFSELLFSCSLRGIGVLNFEADKVSGEDHFSQCFSRYNNHPLALDIGAHIGSHSNKLKLIMPEATRFALEPPPQSLLRLQREALKHGYTAL